jgi:hypothetical protein
MNERLTKHEHHDVITCMNNDRNEQCKQQTVLTKQRSSSDDNVNPVCHVVIFSHEFLWLLTYGLVILTYDLFHLPVRSIRFILLSYKLQIKRTTITLLVGGTNHKMS